MTADMSSKKFSTRQIWRTRLELVVGLVVVIALAALVALALLGRHQHHDNGYSLKASFSHIDGLNVGSDVRLAGVNVGHVLRTQINPRSFQAEVTFSVAPNVQLPIDSGAVVTSDSLLGGKYIALTPGGEATILHAGGEISETQGAISLEQLLSKFIFSVTDSLQTQRQSASPHETEKQALPGMKLQ